MSDIEESESFLEAVNKIIAKREEIKSLEILIYDGVRGLPPDWFPEVFVNDFRRTRDQLIQLYESCEEPLALNNICDLILDQVNSEKPFVSGCPGFRSDNFFYHISVLKRYREISVMDENDGVKELAGIDLFSVGRQAKSAQNRKNRSGKKDEYKGFIGFLKYCSENGLLNFAAGEPDNSSRIDQFLSYLDCYGNDICEHDCLFRNDLPKSLTPPVSIDVIFASKTVIARYDNNGEYETKSYTQNTLKKYLQRLR